jgi:prepilin-type N-terminal cleavage/methylation domain-containing protein
MRRKGFTLVELLVVIAIIALLMGILMPALSRVRQLAFRLTCGTNLSGLGKAMLLYANDYQDELPRAGGRNTGWGAVGNWAGASRYQAFNLAGDGSGGTATISSCFYLLVKYTEVTPKSFVCKGDAGTTEFKLSDLAATTTVSSNFELIDAWDFGPTGESWKHCSYSYHMPFGLYALTVSSEPGFAVAADRNPFLKSPAAEPKVIGGFKPDLDAFKGTQDQAKAGNTISHQLDGQNVMFLDTHVNFEKRAYCSIEDDNIYLVSNVVDKGSPTGVVPAGQNVTPANRKDSVLVHDPGEFTPGNNGPTPRPRPSR